MTFAHSLPDFFKPEPRFLGSVIRGLQNRVKVRGRHVSKHGEVHMLAG